jgi:hypothetical protein
MAQGKRRHARKRFAEVAATPPTKGRDYVSGAAAAYDTQEEDLITKTRKIIATSVTLSSSSSEAPLGPLRFRFALRKSGSLAVHRFHLFRQCPPVIRQIEI